ncbi:flavin reductase [Gordonibacter massiliensis (ex Traore et al. 2017)]|uniref:flavin reductase n=1 Tax=Gordonibacter massiliensis (ex Traore et al. 2017) TaxID=1841863 RepID=UPI001C8CA9EC|nr:flavin reductase [Gordonibacter massiliensis (ex Traore et al. 2017)]MBX9033905.1 flavin reductase [Gordonibacter massiliensis (ex Traore et al. 2017)]
MIDNTAFFSLSYGLYVISSKAGDKAAGCIANTFAQVTSTPLQASVALNKENATTAVIREAGRFEAACLSQEATMELIGNFGFHCSNDRDKFSACSVAVDAAGIPYVAEQACAHFSVRVVQEVDLGTHVLFVGEVEEAEKLGSCEPMTYAYYHQVKGGKTPPKASSYLPEQQPAATAGDAPAPKFAWRCTVCGHMEYVDELPDDFVCPVCGVGKDMFERVEV